MDRLLLPRVRLEPDGVEHPIPEADSPLPRWQTLPMDTKFPVNPAPKGEMKFITTKICQPAFKSKQQADFDLTDPYNRNINSEYKSLHDPFLKGWFANPRLRQQLLKQNLITENGNVSCSVKDFNEYRYYLRQQALIKQKPGDVSPLVRKQTILQEKKLKAEVFGLEVKYKLLKAKQSSKEEEAEKRRKFEERKVQEEERLNKMEDDRRQSVNREKEKCDFKMEEIRKRNETMKRKANQKLKEFEFEAERRLNIIDNIREQKFYELDQRRKEAWRKKRVLQMKALEEAEKTKHKVKAEMMKAKRQYQEKMMKCYAKDKVGIMCKQQEKEIIKTKQNEVFAQRMAFTLEGTEKRTVWENHQWSDQSARARLWLVEEVLDRLGLLPLNPKEDQWQQLLNCALTETVKKLETASTIGEEQQLLSKIVHSLIRSVKELYTMDESPLHSIIFSDVDVSEETEKAVHIAMCSTFDLPLIPKSNVMLGGDLMFTNTDKSYFEKREQFFSTKMQLSESDTVAVEKELNQFLEFLKDESLSMKEMKSIIQLFLMLANHEPIDKHVTCVEKRRTNERRNRIFTNSEMEVASLVKKVDDGLTLQGMTSRRPMGQLVRDIGDSVDAHYVDYDDTSVDDGGENIIVKNLLQMDRDIMRTDENLGSMVTYDLRQPDDSEFEGKASLLGKLLNGPESQDRNENRDFNNSVDGKLSDSKLNDENVEHSDSVDGSKYHRLDGSDLLRGARIGELGGSDTVDGSEYRQHAGSDSEGTSHDLEETARDGDDGGQPENTDGRENNPNTHTESSAKTSADVAQPSASAEKNEDPVQQTSAEKAEDSKLKDSEDVITSSNEITSDTEGEKRRKLEALEEEEFNDLVNDDDVVAVTSHFLGKLQESEQMNGVGFPPYKIHRFIALTLSRMWAPRPDESKQTFGKWLEDPGIEELTQSLIFHLTKCRMSPELLKHLATSIVAALMADVTNSKLYWSDGLVRAILYRFLKDLQREKVTIDVIELVLKVTLESWDDYMESNIEFKFDNFLMEVLGKSHDLVQTGKVSREDFVRSIQDIDSYPQSTRDALTVCEWNSLLHKTQVLLRLGLITPELKEQIKQTFQVVCQELLDLDYDNSLNECIEQMESRFFLDPQFMISAVTAISANLVAGLFELSQKKKISSLTLLPGSLNISQSAAVEPEVASLGLDQQCECIVLLLLDSLAQDLNNNSLSLESQSHLAASLVAILESDYHYETESLQKDNLRNTLDEMTTKFRSKVLGFKDCLQVFSAILRPYLAIKMKKSKKLSDVIYLGHQVHLNDDDLSASFLTLVTEVYLNFVLEIMNRLRQSGLKSTLSASIQTLYVWRTLATLAMEGKAFLHELLNANELRETLVADDLAVEGFVYSMLSPDLQNNLNSSMPSLNSTFLEEVVAMAKRPGFIPVADFFMQHRKVAKGLSEVAKVQDEDSTRSQPTLPGVDLILRKEIIKAITAIAEGMVTSSALARIGPKQADYFVSTVIILDRLVSLLYLKLSNIKRRLTKKEISSENIVHLICNEKLASIPPLTVNHDELIKLMTQGILEVKTLMKEALDTLARMTECLTKMTLKAEVDSCRLHHALYTVSPAMTKLLTKACCLTVLRVTTGLLGGNLQGSVPSVHRRPVSREEQRLQMAAVVVLRNDLVKVRDEVGNEVTEKGMWSPRSVAEVNKNSMLQLPMEVANQVYTRVGHVIDELTSPVEQHIEDGTRYGTPGTPLYVEKGSLYPPAIVSHIIQQVMSCIAFRVEIREMPDVRINDMINNSAPGSAWRSARFQNSSNNKARERSRICDPVLRLAQDMSRNLLHHLGLVLNAMEKCLKDEIETALLVNDDYDTKIQARVFIDVAREKVSVAMTSRVLKFDKKVLNSPGAELVRDSVRHSFSDCIGATSNQAKGTDFTEYVMDLFKNVVDTKDDKDLAASALVIKELIATGNCIGSQFLVGSDKDNDILCVIILEMILNELFARLKRCEKCLEESVFHQTAMPYLSGHLYTKPDPLGPFYAEVLDRQRRLSNFIHPETNAAAVNKAHSGQASALGSCTRCDNSVLMMSTSSFQSENFKARGTRVDALTSKRIASRVAEWRKHIVSVSAANNADSAKSSSSLWRKNLMQNLFKSKGSLTNTHHGLLQTTFFGHEDKLDDEMNRNVADPRDTENLHKDVDNSTIDHNANKPDLQGQRDSQTGKAGKIQTRSRSTIIVKQQMTKNKANPKPNQETAKCKIKTKTEQRVKKVEKQMEKSKQQMKNPEQRGTKTEQRGNKTECQVKKKEPIVRKPSQQISSLHSSWKPRKLPAKKFTPFKDGSWKKAHAQREERKIEVIYHVSHTAQSKASVMVDQTGGVDRSLDPKTSSELGSKESAPSSEKCISRPDHLIKATVLSLLSQHYPRLVQIINGTYALNELTIDDLADLMSLLDEVLTIDDVDNRRCLLQGQGERLGVTEKLGNTIKEQINSLGNTMTNEDLEKIFMATVGRCEDNLDVASLRAELVTAMNRILDRTQTNVCLSNVITDKYQDILSALQKVGVDSEGDKHDLDGNFDEGEGESYSRENSDDEDLNHKDGKLSSSSSWSSMASRGSSKPSKGSSLKGSTERQRTVSSQSRRALSNQSRRSVSNHSRISLSSQSKRSLSSQSKRSLSSQSNRLLSSRSRRSLSSQSRRSLSSQSKRSLSNQSKRSLANQSRRSLSNQSRRSLSNQSRRSLSNQSRRSLSNQSRRSLSNQSRRSLSNQSRRSLSPHSKDVSRCSLNRRNLQVTHSGCPSPSSQQRSPRSGRTSQASAYTRPISRSRSGSPNSSRHYPLSRSVSLNSKPEKVSTPEDSEVLSDNDDVTSARRDEAENETLRNEETRYTLTLDKVDRELAEICELPVPHVLSDSRVVLTSVDMGPDALAWLEGDGGAPYDDNDYEEMMMGASGQGEYYDVSEEFTSPDEEEEIGRNDESYSDDDIEC